jgi:NAD(P)-dependent dehydrogenase (short-subunit alcohol dehydrogenase family)
MWIGWIIVCGGPVVTLIYSVTVLIFRACWKECSWWEMNQCIGMTISSVVVSIAIARSMLYDGRNTMGNLWLSGLVSFMYSLWSLHHVYSVHVQGRCRLGNNNTETLLHGKVILITGANSGIGKETAKQLFQYGASTIILACRNAERAEEAIREILQSSSTTLDAVSSRQRLRFLPLDLSDLESVRNAVQTFLQWKLPLHILINNAGVFVKSYQTSPQGYEMTMVSNHLGHFLLTYLLLPTLLQQQQQQQDQPARVINITSSTYRLASRMEVEDLLCTKRPYSFFGQYAQSKLANILFTIELAQRYPKSLRTYAVHPGLVRTNGML